MCPARAATSLATLRLRPSLHALTLARAAALVAAAVAIAFLARYHVSLARSHAAFARPSDGPGPVAVTGVAGGVPIVTPAGDEALATVTEVWDRPPARKGARVVCRAFVSGALTLDGRAVSWSADGPAISVPGKFEPALSPPPRIMLDLVTPVRSAPIPFGRCAVESALPGRVVEVRALRPGDALTIVGCIERGALSPCGDGRDLLSARTKADARRQSLSGDSIGLFAAVVLGSPSLLFLVYLLARHTASLPRGRAR